MPVTSLVNYRFAFNDFEFGGGDSVYQIMTIDGLEDLPVIRNQDDNRGYQDGMWTGRDFLSGRTLVFVITIRGDSNHSMQYYLNELQANLVPQQQGTGLLQFQLPDNDLQRFNARVRRRAITINTSYSSGLATATYEFFCPDPRYYDDQEQSTDLINATAVAGRTYNRVYTTPPNSGSNNPLEDGMYFGGGAGAPNLINNYGWTTTYPVITIEGPCVNPKITNVTAGLFLQIDTTLGTSDTLIINTDLRTVTLNGISRRALLNNASTWFAAPPGTSYYTFTATGTDGNTACVVSWRSAYI
jgi:phage-related protein